MAKGYGFCETGLELPVLICILVMFVVSILVSCFTNWYLNDSNNLSRDCFTSKERLCKGALKVSS